MSPDPRDLLPQPPWEGPPFPRFLSHPRYIQSRPPGEYLYHHSNFTGLRMIAESWRIRASGIKRTVSLTTDVGRFLSPLPFIMAVTVDGVVRMPYSEIADQVIPCLYVTREVEVVEKAKRLGYQVFEQPPPEYRWILWRVTHHVMFASENEYVTLEDLGLPSGSMVFIHPMKLKRFLGSMRGRFTVPVRSLEELAP